MVPFRHHSPRTPPSPSPILKHCTSDLSPSGRFSSTRYGPHPCSTKVLFDLAFEYSVPVVFIVSLLLSLISITQSLTHNPQCHPRSIISPNPTWFTTGLLFLACNARFRRPLGYQPPRSRRSHHPRRHSMVCGCYLGGG